MALEPSLQPAAREALTAFAAEVKAVLTELDPGRATTTFATSLYAAHNGSKGAWPFFDLGALSEIVDFFFVMGYGTCALSGGEPATSNSDVRKLAAGVAGYRSLGINVSEKVVLGLPWYGFDNVCMPATVPNASRCVRTDSSRSERSLYNWTTDHYFDPKRTDFEGTAMADLARLGVGDGHTSTINYDEPSED